MRVRERERKERKGERERERESARGCESASEINRYAQNFAEKRKEN